MQFPVLVATDRMGYSNLCLYYSYVCLYVFKKYSEHYIRATAETAKVLTQEKRKAVTQNIILKSPKFSLSLMHYILIHGHGILYFSSIQFAQTFGL